MGEINAIIEQNNNNVRKCQFWAILRTTFLDSFGMSHQNLDLHFKCLSFWLRHK